MTEETIIDWGAEIPVNKRPLWLIDDEQRVAFHDGADWYGLNKVFWSAEELDDEPNLKAIRLPVGHEYYSRPTASEHPEYSPELVEAAKSLNAAIWRCLPADRIEGTPIEEASVALRAILSELDKSKEVDRVKSAADAIVEDWLGNEADTANQRELVARGIRRGMELAKDEAA